MSEDRTYSARSGEGFARLVKVLVLLIPVFLIGYLIFANFIASQEFSYVYDIGQEGESYLTPSERISEVVNEEDVDYRNVAGHLVYFDVPIARGIERVRVKMRIKNNLPAGGKASIGARDQEEWHYNSHLVYDPSLDVGNLDRVGNVYRVNPDAGVVDFSTLRELEDVTIATDEDFGLVENIVLDYRPEETVIDTTLRGGHVFYLYAGGDLSIEVKKRDLNWYVGSDEIIMFLSDAQGNLVGFMEVGDDGDVSGEKELGPVQRGNLLARDLEEGVYKLEISDFDGLITEIKVNTNKIVAEKVFLADSSAYRVDTKQSQLYFDYNGDVKVRMITHHAGGLQKVLINQSGAVSAFDFNVEDESMFLDLSAGRSVLTFTKNDIVLESQEYFTFIENGYFKPFKQKVVPLGSEDWIMDGVDYIVTDYVAPKEDGEWLIVEGGFDIVDDGLYVSEKGTLSLMFNLPYLSKEENAEHVVPIDWIEIEVYKPGVWDK